MGFDSEIYSYTARELQIPVLKMTGRFAAGLELGDQLASFCILLIMAGYLWQKPRLVRTFVGGLFALAAGGIAVQIFKHLIGRARPAMALGDWYFIGPHFSRGFDSFPSGHTTALFALVAFCCRYYPGWSIPLYSVGILLSILGRVVTGQHFVSDVVGGVILGAAVGIFLAGRFRGYIEASQPLPVAVAAAGSSARERPQIGEADSRAWGKFTMLKEIFVVIAFSSTALFIGLRSPGPEFSSPLAPFFGLLTGLVTYFLARELCGTRAGIYAALILSSSFLFVNSCRALLADVPSLFFTALGFLSYVYWARRHPRSNLLLVMSYASLGLGLLANGPVALFPAVVFVLYEYLSEKPPLSWFILRNGLRHALLLVFTFLVFALWLGYGLLGGQEAASLVFLDQVVTRGLPVIARRSGPLIYYLPVLLLALFPWTFFLIAYLVKEGKRWLSETVIDPDSLLLLIWASVVFGLFPFIAAKAPHYMVLALPPLSCLLARFMTVELAEPSGVLRSSLVATLVCTLSLSVAPAVVYWLRPQYEALKFAPPFAILSGFLLAGWLLGNRYKRPVLFAAICLGALGFYLSAAMIAL